MEAVLLVIFAVLAVIPLMKLLPAYGINPWWALVVIVPLGLIVLLWVMAGRMDRLRPAAAPAGGPAGGAPGAVRSEREDA